MPQGNDAALFTLTADWALQLDMFLIWANIAICLPTSLLNLYFAFRFGRLSTFSANLKCITITVNLCVTFTSVAHPLAVFVPEEWYSVERGRHLEAALFYGSQLLNRVFLFFFAAKFLMIALERRYAFRHRSTYEGVGCGKAVLGIFAFFMSIVVAECSHIWVAFQRSAETSLDRKLQEVIIMDRSPMNYTVFYGICSVSFLYTIYELRSLTAHTRANRFTGSQLTESFQMKQTLNVLQALWPLFFGHVIMVSLTGTFYLIMLYDFYIIQPNHQISMLFRACCDVGLDFVGSEDLQADYLIGTTYILFSTIYMIYRFQSLRKLVIDDINRLCGMQICSHRRAAALEDRAEEQKAHFEYLKRIWG